jgi:flagellar motor protein MotB
MTKCVAKIPDRLGRMASALLLVLAVSAFAVTGASAAAPDAAQNNAAQNKQQLVPQQQQKHKQQTNRQQQLPNQTQQDKSKQKGKEPAQTQQQKLQTQQQQKLKTQEQAKQPSQNQTKQQQNAEFQHFDWDTYHPGKRPPLWAQYRQDFDPRPYQWARNAPRHYEVRYLPPPGWRYQRWNYGQIFPRPYWNQPYWLTNYSQYGLEPLPYGYVWVQYGPDALAVDSFSGTILQVIYGLFSSSGY